MGQIFGYTPPNPSHGYVGFIQVFEHEGELKVVVRGQGGNGVEAACPITLAAADELSEALQAIQPISQCGLRQFAMLEANKNRAHDSEPIEETIARAVKIVKYLKGQDDV